MLFRTRNSVRCWKNDQFVEDFVYISAAAAQFLVQRQVRTSVSITSRSGVMCTMASKPIGSSSARGFG